MVSQGMTFGEHVIVRHIATGATSEVFEARHRVSGHAAAVKVLHADWCLDEGIVKRFLNEALALQHMDHPHIVGILDCSALPSGPPFMILEWLPSDLHRLLSRVGGALALDVGVRIAMQIASALGALHERGIVHRDLKPANVLLSHENPAAADVKLADLGLAKLLPAATGVNAGPAALSALHVSTGQRAVFGTWEYMAPEQWVQSKTVDAKADVYSLGVLLFQMLTGRLPFVAAQEKDWMYYHVIEDPPLHLLEDRVPRLLRDLVGRMLSKKGPQRPTMQDVVIGLGGSQPTTLK
jgi:eukaryotic-like serine/threonine-protein kinase